MRVAEASLRGLQVDTVERQREPRSARIFSRRLRGPRRYAGRVAIERITVDPNKMGGVPIIRDLRMPVGTVVAMVADGMTVEEILADFPDLEPEDIRAALHFTRSA